MQLHRGLVQGAGFFEWAKTTRLTSMPTVNLLDFGDDVLADAIVQEALPIDRARFRGYLSNRHLGCGLIIAVSLTLLTEQHHSANQRNQFLTCYFIGSWYREDYDLRRRRLGYECQIRADPVLCTDQSDHRQVRSENRRGIQVGRPALPKDPLGVQFLLSRDCSRIQHAR